MSRYTERPDKEIADLWRAKLDGLEEAIVHLTRMIAEKDRQLRAARMALDYDCRDLAESQALGGEGHRRLWSANMRAHRYLSGTLEPEPRSPA